MRKIEQFFMLVVLFLLVLSCKKDSIYDPPGWLAGKLYTQITDYPELSTFVRCIELAGYDTIINVSGSYTVFAPDNDAFDLYLQEHSYSSVEDIPITELERIVKFHIVQNPWSTNQLRQLDVWGWIDSLDLNNDEPRGFKRETLLREKDRKYGVENSRDVLLPREVKRFNIVDTLESNWYRRQATDARKFAPIFYQEYFNIYDLNSDDYAYYFGRPFESSSMYFVNAKIIKADIFAENGFVHIVDRVVDPLKNAFQLLNSQSGENSYTDFLNLINTFPVFDFNQVKTDKQPGASLGSRVDSLYDITYPDLAFGIVNEKTTAPSGATGLPANVTIRYHHGLIAPTNAAFDEFVNEYFVGPGKWGSMQNAPRHIRRMVVNTHMANGPLYPTNFSRGFFNGEDDWITLDQSTVIQKQFGSNCTFVGVNKVVVPRTFSSVTGPVYLQRGYSRVMYAIEQAGLLPALKRRNNNYMLFVEQDANLRIDSSLLYDPILQQFSLFQITEFSARRMAITITDLRNLILNHIGVEQPNGLARKEFIKNLAGNYLIVNNETGEVRGSAPTTIGYLGAVQTTVIPQQISTNADNGKTYDIANWFNFSSGDIFLKIAANYPAFQNLLRRAGLTLDREYRYTFTSPDENYTVFVPNAAALSAYNSDTLTTEELKSFLMMHFVTGSLIFTDGHKNPGYYETTRVDEKSTQYTKIFTKLYIDLKPDAIQFPRKNGTNYLSVNESGVTNQMMGRILNQSSTATFPTIVTNGVIHEIDKVLLFNVLDTE
jgi:uncharacterized surface protein with fasciclin (FAS1) repeats